MSDHFFRKKLGIQMPPSISVKWGHDLLDEGYVPFPKKLIRAAPHVFIGEKGVEQLCVVLALVDYVRAEMTRPPSIGYLAFTAGMDADRFEERLRELVAAGLVTWMGNREQLKFELQGLYRAIREQSGEE